MIHPLRPLARSIGYATASSLSLALLAGAGTTLLASPALAAETADQVRTVAFDVPAGPLDQALGRFGRQAGIPLSTNASLTAGKRSSGVQGRYGVDEGLARLLAGTGLASARQADGSYLLIERGEAGDALEIGATSISGSAALGATTEGSGSYTTGETSVGTKLPASLRETPQSVTVVTRQRMDDQNLQKLEDIATYTPGLTLRKTGGERPEFYSRGAAMDNIMIDGLPVAYDSDTLGTSSLPMYDHVEVVRGASGLMVGAGNPSGTLNLVRKRPTDTPRLSISASVGRWDDYRTELDVSNRLDSAGDLRGRFVAAYQDRNSFVDAYGNKRQLFYGIGEYDLGPATTLTLGAYYNREDNPGADWNGLPTRPDGSFFDFPRSTRTAPDWTYWDKENRSVFAEVEHRFDNDWKLRLNGTWLRGDMEMLGGSFYTDENDDYHLNVGRYTYQHTQKSFDTYLSGPFSLFGATHELVVGASFRRDDTDDGPGGPGIDTDVIVDPTRFDPKAYAKPAIEHNWSRDGREEQSSTYATARFNLREDLRLILGSRLDWYDYEQTTHSGGYTFGDDYKATREYTPYAGLIHDLDDTYSVYASWTRIFKPQAAQDAGGSLLEPVTGTNYEAGIKGEYFDGALNASLALFQLVQENLAKSLPSSQCSTGISACYEASGEVRTRGIELELGGELAAGWQVSAGYTYAGAEYTRSTDSASKGDRFDSDTPYNLFKVFTTYRLPGALDKWTVGGGFRTQSGAYTSFGVKQGGYSVSDLMLGYQPSQEWQLQANLNNAFDKRYYQNISNSWGANSFGDPRSLMLTVRYSPSF
ncbi:MULTISPECIES: TonB-dependent siderophore receptor [unclassified Pseudomonas]|uniref:TonB-dependent siderophore receptor n=1 Tax=unclassified Pseudomonas TaxID=196821 RepID=UPI002447D15F|nr:MULTISPECIES: TonB-dependent siderophore receptor [unclassified Pseudomonas]MDG9929101.1 TonB-dependent receptor [Pseudomonas sp. GD04042]MDH0485975.1 TonB-dependent receptor [Pseudomonas sp. GD04015]MDH0604887.1 TonB-dependent receptor [Pseudomonas sp. GD03869]